MDIFLLETFNFLLSLPAGFQGLLTILLIGSFDESESLRVEHLNGPSDSFRLIILRLALGPEMEQEDRLDNIVMLDFLAFLFTWSVL